MEDYGLDKAIGDVAASGGYMIAAPGSRIFANPLTVTGSIGVFLALPMDPPVERRNGDRCAQTTAYKSTEL